MPIANQLDVRYDLFISHNSRDKAHVQGIGEQLLDKHEVNCWVDVWSIPAAADWRIAIDRALDTCGAAAVVVGVDGFGPVHGLETAQILRRREQDAEFVLVPLVLCNDAQRVTDVLELAQARSAGDQAQVAQLLEFFRNTNCVVYPITPEDEALPARQDLALDGVVQALRNAGRPPHPVGPDVLTPIRIRRDARLWLRAARHASHFYGGRKLADARHQQLAAAGQLDDLAIEFLDACSRHEQRVTRAWIVGLAAAVVVLTGLALAAVLFARAATRESKIARSRLLAAEATQPELPRDHAVLKALEAHATATTEEARIALHRLLFDTREVGTILGMAAPVTAMASDPTGSYLATGDQRGDVVVWRIPDGAIVTQARLARATAVQGLVFSDRETVHAVSQDAELCRITVVDGTMQCAPLQIEKPVLRMISIPDHSSRAVICHGMAAFSTVDLGSRTVRTVRLPGTGHDLVVMTWDLEPSGRRVAVETYDRAIRFLDLTSGATTPVPLSGSEQHLLRFDASGALASIGGDGRATVWRGEGEPTRTFQVTARPVAATPLDHGGWAVSSSDGTTIVTGDPSHPSGPAVFPALQRARISALERVAEILATASADGTIVLWNRGEVRATSRTIVAPERRHVSRLTFDPGGTLLAAGTDDGAVMYWSLEGQSSQQPTSIGTLQPATRVRALAFGPAGDRIAFAGQDDNIHVVELASGRETKLAVGEHMPIVNGLEFDRVAPRLLSVSATKGLVVHSLSGPDPDPWDELHDVSANALAYDRSGQLIALLDNDGRMATRDARGRRQAPPAQVHDGIVTGLSATNRDEEFLSSGYDGRVVVFHPTATAPTLRCDVRPPGQIVVASAHAADASVFASISDTTIAVWSSVEACRMTLQLPVPETRSAALAITRDGTRVAWSRESDQISIMELPTGEALVAAACAKVHVTRDRDWQAVYRRLCGHH